MCETSHNRMHRSCTSGSRVAVLLTQMMSYASSSLPLLDLMSSHTSAGAPASSTAHSGSVERTTTWKPPSSCACSRAPIEHSIRALVAVRTHPYQAC